MVSLPADNKTARRPVGTTGRRAGSVLILVMTVLGVLFAVGLAFMATMNFDAEIISAEKQMARTKPAIETVIEDALSAIDDTLLPTPGVELSGELVGSTAFSFAELPGVHNLFSPIEPYRNSGSAYVYRYAWLTDIAALLKEPFQGTPLKGVEAIAIDRSGIPGAEPWRMGIPYYEAPLDAYLTPVDADGDGMADGLQYELITKGPANDLQLVVDSAQLDELRKVLNPPTNPRGKVHLGLRVVAHGGMVNLNHSHEMLVSEVLAPNDAYHDLHLDIGFELPQRSAQFTFYDPAVEEPPLRRRGLIPGRIIPPSRVQGNLADPDDVEAGGGEYLNLVFPPVRDGSGDTRQTLVEHDYWPYAADELDGAGLEVPWAQRMDRNSGLEYDLRHLITTISHDDLLMRDTYVELLEVDPEGNGFIGKRYNVVEMMDRANRQYLDLYASGWRELRNDKGEPLTCQELYDTYGVNPVLPFEYLQYPHSPDPQKSDYDWCKCAADPDCDFSKQPVKGKLRLSLPWLEKALKDNVITDAQFTRIIQNAFTVLLLNARGTEWGNYTDVVDGFGIAKGWTDLDEDNFLDSDEPRDRVWEFKDEAFAEISRTVAALTANLIDFMDFEDLDSDGLDDGEPTQVELRSADFRPLKNATGSILYGLDGPRMAFGLGTAQELPYLQNWLGVTVQPPLPPSEYVYGLERQPYITEVVAVAPEDIDDGAAGDPDGHPDSDYFLGIEVFNPHDDPIVLTDRFFLRFDHAAGAHVNLTTEVALTGILPGTTFRGFRGAASNLTLLENETGIDDIVEVPDLRFDNQTRIYLVRRVGFIDVVVDEFDLTEQVGLSPPFPVSYDGLPVGTWDDKYRSCQRVAQYDPLNRNLRWKAPIPMDFMGDSAFSDPLLDKNSTFGLRFYGRSDASYTKMPPVEALFADTESFSDAFPTTGSLLLLMRFANGDLDAGGVPFTSYLDDEVSANNLPVDNGRMPVFDAETRHHEDPARDRSSGPSVAWETGKPGELFHLPWGQLVFDYFTALPLSSEGPVPFLDGSDGAIPKVDLDGLRVHGRININAAPATVLASLPLLQMDKFPLALRGYLEGGVDPNSSYDPDETVPLGVELAEAIVAYREAREVGGSGNYDSSAKAAFGRRGWQVDDPTVRRGTGFMTVGELANVRHNDGEKAYRIDRGPVDSVFPNHAELQLPEPSYIDAVAPLVALGDWVTVRSHVFTVYGVLRGENDEDLGEDAEPPLTEEEKNELRAADVNSRAIRFQETVDRIPILQGKTAPTRIGKRTVASYNDFSND